MVKSKRMLSLFGWFFLIVVILFLVVPFIPLMIWSMTKHWPWPLLLPQDFTWAAWVYIFSPSGRGLGGLLNSLIIAFLTLAINIVLGIPAARILAQRQFIGKMFVFLVFLSPLFVPFTASMIGMYSFSMEMDFLNEYVRVTLAHVLITIPYFIATVWYQYKSLGTDMLEAAKSLGANVWQILLWIELPQLIPALSLGSVFVFIISLSQYLPTWIMSGGTMLTLPVIIFPFASSGDASIVAAYSLWFFVPIISMVIIHFFILRIHKRYYR